MKIFEHQAERDTMATSSIFHNIVISDPKKAEAFVDAIEASIADPRQKPDGTLAQVAADKEEIRRLHELRRKKRSADQ